MEIINSDDTTKLENGFSITVIILLNNRLTSKEKLKKCVSIIYGS